MSDNATSPVPPPSPLEGAAPANPANQVHKTPAAPPAGTISFNAPIGSLKGKSPPEFMKQMEMTVFNSVKHDQDESEKRKKAQRNASQ